MGAQALLVVLSEKGIKISLDGDMIEVDPPRGAMTDDLRVAIRQHKAELVALLRNGPDNDRSPAPLGKIGRHGEPCPECGDTWQWPTSRGRWVCSWCICAAPGPVQIATPGGDIIKEGSDGQPDSDRAACVKRCERCGGTQWGPSGRYEADGTEVWCCLVCNANSGRIDDGDEVPTRSGRPDACSRGNALD